jgi:hypothetical protein
MNMLKRLPIDGHIKRMLVEHEGPHIPTEGLQALLNHECLALQIHNFYGPNERASFLQDVDRTLQSNVDAVSNWKVSQSDGKLVDSEVATIGTPLNVAKGLNSVPEYFSTSLKTTRRFRSEGRMTPIDKIRLELDEIYPYGCVLGRDETTKQPHLGGLLRIMTRSTSRGLVHMDEAAELSPQRGVFSANVYLQMSQAGGELEIWPVGFREERKMMEYALEIGLLTSASADPQAQRALREFVLPDPPLLIKPQSGDLVMLCVQRPHSVKGPIHGGRKRVSAQTFIVKDSSTAPLKVEV